MARPCVIPENILRLMDSADRPTGAAGLLAREAVAKAALRLERDEHKTVLAWARLNAIWCLHAPTCRRSTVLPIGWPDFTFIYGLHHLFVEMKVAGNKLSEDQARVRAQLEAQGAVVLTSDSAAETISQVRSWLGELGWSP